jgi:hypothetical protein
VLQSAETGDPSMETAVQLRDFLQARRTAIVDRWTELTLEVYPSDAARLMTREKDRFQNPVGHVTRKSLEEIYDGLVAGRPAEEMTGPLDGIVRIRAVQDLFPSQALGFLFLLKPSVRDQFGEETTIDLTALDFAIDRLTLEAFDLFMRCREQIHGLRRNEIKQQASALLERRNRLADEEQDRVRT